MTKATQSIGVLFICLGNICRSPAAEGIFQALVEKRGLSDMFKIDSAGTSGYHDGDLPDTRMRAAGKTRNYAFDSISRKLVVEDFDQFDYLIVMDQDNHRNTLTLTRGPADQQKVFPMIDFIYTIDEIDGIPDPYFGGAEGFEHVLNLLEEGCENLLDILVARHGLVTL